ncbi:hypothetical protein C1645_781930 [Glomus cerebriforme]|uniref:Uncharacterized protein n=1 Tax=Glomus cerebriforme TaxID=658196 RepID=A0A397SRY4_9GLOM|nr:hypothetical protein C1645_781930 [Glomus cerebriforme]
MQSTFSTLTPTILGGGNSSAPIIQESDRIPITIAISAFVILFFLSLLFVYVRRNHKKSQQRSLASAIVAAEAGELPSRTTLRDSPSPPPPPPPPPPTPLPHALLDDDENRPPPPRYKISTLQIEPMTRRLTMNLSQKGKSIIVNEGDKRSNQVRRGSANTEDIQDEEECQEIINVISLRDDDDDESSEENEGKGKGKRFSIRKNFWK